MSTTGRRRKMVPITHRLLYEFFTTGHRINVTCTKGLPADARMVGHDYDAQRDEHYLVFESDTWAEVPYGDSLPRLLIWYQEHHEPAIEAIRSIPPGGALFVAVRPNATDDELAHVHAKLVEWAQGRRMIVARAGDLKFVHAQDDAAVVPCPTCGQTDHGQTGEYPCPACGLPRTHDEVPE